MCYNRILLIIAVVPLSAWLAGGSLAQERTVPVAEPEPPVKGEQAGGLQAESVVHRLIRFNGVMQDSLGQPRAGIVGVTFTLLEMFSTEEARWLGIQVQGEPEQARVLLVSVPYALKAADAERLGGKPLSAFVLSDASEAAGEEPVDEPKAQVNGSGTTNMVAKFTATDTIGDSQIFDNGTNVGIGSTAPLDRLHVNGNIRLIGQTTHQVQMNGAVTAGRLGQDANGFFFASDTAGKELNFFTNAGAGIQKRFTITGSGNIGIGTATPAEKVHVVGNLRLDSLLDLGTDACSVVSAAGRGRLCFNGTKFRVSENGGAYQDLGAGGGGGSGDITAVNAGTGLTGGGDSGDVTLAVDFAGPGAASTAARSDHSHALAGDFNTGLGEGVLATNSGPENTALGAFALDVNTTGVGNTGVGSGALGANTTGNFNTAVGVAALFNSNGDENTALGHGALSSSTSGNLNTAVGKGAMANGLTPSENTAVGRDALALNNSSHNTAVGTAAMINATGEGNTAVGHGALGGSAGNDNIAIGRSAGASPNTGSFNIYIGNPGAAESNTIRIGSAGQTKAFIAGIVGQTVDSVTDQAVLIDATGKLGTLASTRRAKEDIRDMGEASAGLRRLRPVVFRYRQAAPDGSKPVQYGLIAEEVAEAMPELVVYGADGQAQTVKYHVLPALLLNELQRQEKELVQQRNEMGGLRQALAAQAVEMAKLKAALRGREELTVARVK